jgi:hypothetical protein
VRLRPLGKQLFRRRFERPLAAETGRSAAVAIATTRNSAEDDCHSDAGGEHRRGQLDEDRKTSAARPPPSSLSGPDGLWIASGQGLDSRGLGEGEKSLIAGSCARAPFRPRRAPGSRSPLVRLSVGCEHPDDLWRDLEHALTP